MCYRPEGYRALTISDVDRAFQQLLLVNGVTTSLEVKNYLRKQGFWAVQEEVGAVIRLLAEEEGIFWESYGYFRVYYQSELNNEFANLVSLYSFNLN